MGDAIENLGIKRRNLCINRNMDDAVCQEADVARVEAEGSSGAGPRTASHRAPHRRRAHG